MKKIFLFVLLFFFPILSFAEDKILNIYAWAGEVPDAIIRQFENETGIKVNFSTYDNNEIMYAKVRSMRKNRYDLIIPSSYFVDRMRKQNLLEKLDNRQIPNRKNLDPQFLNLNYDPESQYSIPFVWGLTGIFFNDKYYKANEVNRWTDLWNPIYQNQVILLDDTREIFSMGLLTLAYSPNDNNPSHIQSAYQKLKLLMPNVKVFSSDMIVSIMIDEDAKLGMAWNGDVYKAQQENPHIHFVFPKDGFVIWIDNFCLIKDAPHPTNAYAFLNFILRPEIGKKIALATRYPITNLKAKQLLPESVRNNPIIYPSKKILANGQYQKDIDEHILGLYEKYWEQLKMSG